MANDTGGTLGRDEIWRRIAAGQIDVAAATAALRLVLANLSPEQQAAPPTPPLRRMFVRAALEIGGDGDVRERLALGHLLDGEFARAAERYEALIQASADGASVLLRRKGALFLVVDPLIAREAFERAVAAAPLDGDAWLGLCFARERLGDRSGGREAFAEASAHGADLTILDDPEPAPMPSERAIKPETLDRLRPIRGLALDGAVALFPKARDRFPRLATHFPEDEPAKWDLVAALGVAWFAYDRVFATVGEDDYLELARYLFRPDTRRKTYSPIPPGRRSTFDANWEKLGYELLMGCMGFVADATTALWTAAVEKGLSEREARGRRTRAKEADWLGVAEWVMGRMYDSNDVGEPEHRLEELGRWLAEAGKGPPA